MENQKASPISEHQGALEALLNGPAGTPPAGVQPNFDNPGNLNTIIIIIKTIALTIATLAILIRIYTRQHLSRSMGYDDYTSILAWLGLIAYITLSFLATYAGAGIHMWDMRLSAFFRLLYWTNVVEIVYNPVNVLVKASILLQYSRIFNPTGKNNLPMFIAIHVSLWVIILFYFVLMFFVIFQCNPRELIWDKLASKGHCYDNTATLEATGVFNVLSDFGILILPLSSIWKLQMTLKRRLLISGVFAIGSLACIISIVRTSYSWQLAASPDYSHLLAVYGLCSDVELSVGILIGCFPIMPKFFQHVGPKISKALSFRWKAASSHGHDLGRRTMTSKTHTIAKIKNPFAKDKVGSSVVESCNDPYAQLHGEHYIWNGIEPSQPQAATELAPIQVPSARVATRRDDLEYGHERF